MRIKFVIATTLVVAIFLSACNRDYVALDYTNAKGEVPQLGNLIFRFDKSLMPDSLLNNSDSTDYISFEPRITGRFRWESPDQLVFSPTKPLAPATTYRAKVHGDVLRYSKYDKVSDNDKIEFHTAPLQLSDVQTTWVSLEEGGRLAAPQINLLFNYPVSPEVIKEKLKIEVDGSKAEYVLQTISPSNNVVARLTSFKGEDKSYEARIVLENGIKPEAGKNATTEKIETVVTIPSPYVLSVNDVQSEHDGAEGIVRISTSQQLTGNDLTDFVKFEPAVKYRVEYTDFGVALYSDQFSAENSYALTIAKGLRGSIGGVLKEEYNGSVAFGQLESSIRFTNSKGIYLSRKGGGNIEVMITNTPKVKLVISKIYESNLLMAQRYGYTPREEDEARFASYSDEDNEYSESLAGDVVYSKEIDTRSLPKSGSGRILNISQFEDRLPELKGIYHVMLRSTEDYWVQDSRFISLSDLGLIAKQGEDKMLVFVNSIKSASAINNVSISVYGSNNQLLGTGASNDMGVAEISIAKKAAAGFKPAMIIAKTTDDFNYLPFNNTKVNTSRFDVGGKRNNATGLDAFVYAERDIYRPGETVNFAVMLRDRNWKSPGELPVKMKFLLPNGKELKSFRKSLNEGGMAEGNVTISQAAITGSYSLEVYSSNDVLLATKNFMIEEFVPDRIKVSAKLNKPYLKPGDNTQLQINAVNFFGPAAANRNFEVEMQVKQKQFSNRQFGDYEFELTNGETFDKVLQQGKTDAGGNAAVDYAIPSFYANAGVLQANFYTTVFDETGRPVSRTVSADIFTQDIFNGIKDDGYYYYPLNQPVGFRFVSLNKDGKVVPATARLQVIKHEYKTVLVKSGSYFRYESQQEDKVMMDGTLTVGNATLYQYVPRSPGDYEIRLYRPGANRYVSKRFYSYGDWGGDSRSFEVNNEGHIDIELDKEKYNVGDVAKVLFKTPFSGRMLVTLERDAVFSYQYIDVTKRTASLDLKLEGKQVPNIYVTATLIKPHEVTDIPLTVAHGFYNIKVEERSRIIPVAIKAQANSRSGKKQKVVVKATPGSYVTLAAVDNGVLQVTNFKTPDPYNHYYQKKALEVSAFDLYPLLFPELRARLSSTGGDGESDMDKRVNPMPAKRIKILSYWSGVRKTGGNGQAEFEIDIPQFNGQVRLMAVAAKDEKFGSAEATMTVADPIVISSSLPRFLSPGDTALVPVTISNTTAKATTGTATISVTGPVKVLGSARQAITISANSEARSYFQVVSDPAVAIASISVSVQALGENFTEKTEISVRPPSTLQQRTGAGSVVGGATQVITIPPHDFLPASFDYELVVSRSPVAEIANELRYLVQYPYGCTEQTISAAFPQLYYGDLVNTLQKKNSNQQNAVANVLEAIRKIKMRQLYNGALTLWDGEGSEDWWTTAYAAHFLLEARKAGYDVDNSLLETMLGYLVNRLKTKETIIYHYNRDQKKKIAPKEVSYSLYVLALANRSQVSAMNYYKANPQLLALDGKYLLSASYAIAGDKRSFAGFLPSSFSGEVSLPQTGGSFYSPTRDEAIALNALIDVDPGNAQIQPMARQVSDRLKKEKYLNTQERAFSFLALGKLARMANQSSVSADIKVNGRTVARINGNDWRAGKEILKGNKIEVATTGKGRLYYSWQASGISTSGAYVAEDQFIKVRRQYFNRNGQPITTTNFKQNDLVIVALTLERAFSGNIQNIVLTDLLPAGFEIENPRIKDLPGMDWVKNAGVPTAMDVRDDRIHFFVDANNTKQTYYYAVRAVSLGYFRQGPVSAEAMYNGAIHSYHGAGIIRVLPQ